MASKQPPTSAMFYMQMVTMRAQIELLQSHATTLSNLSTGLDAWQQDALRALSRHLQVAIEQVEHIEQHSL